MHGRQIIHVRVVMVTTAKTVNSPVLIVTLILASMAVPVCCCREAVTVVIARRERLASSVNWMQGMNVPVIHARAEPFVKIGWAIMAVIALTRGVERTVTYTIVTSAPDGVIRLCQRVAFLQILLQLILNSSVQSVLLMDVGRNLATTDVMKNAIRTLVILMVTTVPSALTRGRTVQHLSTAGRFS